MTIKTTPITAAPVKNKAVRNGHKKGQFWMDIDSVTVNFTWRY